MRPIGEAGYVLSSKEFTFLASMSGAQEIYGIEDDIYFMSEIELRKEWKKVKSQLEAKKYIDVAVDGTIIIDKELYALIDACCYPKAIIRYTENKIHEEINWRNYYFAEEIAVELDKDRLLENTFILTPIVSIEKSAINICECFSIEDCYGKLLAEFRLPMKKFKKIIEHIKENKKEDVISILLEFECEKGVGEDIFYALKEKKLYKSMTIDCLTNEDSTNYTVIAGQKYLWQFETKITGINSEIIFKTCNAKEVADKVVSMILSLIDIYKSSSERIDVDG